MTTPDLIRIVRVIHYRAALLSVVTLFGGLPVFGFFLKIASGRPLVDIPCIILAAVMLYVLLPPTSHIEIRRYDQS